MRQSNVIFGVLIFVFVVYITMRGQLPAYMDLFKPQPPKQSSTSSSGGLGGMFGKALKYFKGNADKAAQIILKGG